MDDNWGYPHDLGNLHATSGAHEFFYRVRLFGSSGYVTFAVKPKRNRVAGLLQSWDRDNQWIGLQ